MKKLLLTLFLLAVLLPQLHAGEVVLKTARGVLYGTQEVQPAGRDGDSVPVVLIISGSGPTDRDGNSSLLSGKNNSLKYFGEELARNGIASLRYDKRGIGKSAASMIQEKDLRLETYIEDAEAWVDFLRSEKKYSGIFIAGHSEGSLIGMIAARHADVDGFISLAGAGRPAQDLIIHQLKHKLSPDLVTEAGRIIDALKSGKAVKSPPPALKALFRESVQPYLMSWFRYDPAKEINTLQCPVLIVQGTTDLQVSVDDAEMLQEGNRKARLCIIEGMNHVLKEVSGDLQQQLVSYGDPSLPVSGELIREISGFVWSVQEDRL